MKSPPSKTLTIGQRRKFITDSTAASLEKFLTQLNRNLIPILDRPTASNENFKVQSLKCDSEELQSTLKDAIRLLKNMETWSIVLSNSSNGLLERDSTIGDGVGDLQKTYESSFLAYLISLVGS